MQEHVMDIASRVAEILNLPINDVRESLLIALSGYSVTVVNTSIVVRPTSDEERAYKMYFVAKHTEGLSEKSLNYYRDRLHFIFRTIQKPFLRIETDDIRLYLAKRGMVDKIAKTTLNNERRVLSSFYSWLTAEEYISKNPMMRIGNIKEEKRIKKPFTEEEMETLRKQVASNPRGLAILEFLYSTGVRVGEMVQLNAQDIDFLNGFCIVFGKGAKERRVFLNTKSRMAIKDYLNGRTDNALFLAKNNKRLTIGGVEAWLTKLSKISGVAKVHPHKFRRTAATVALNRGMPIHEVSQMLGHAKIETTTLYAQTSNDNVQQSHKKFIT